MKIRRRSGKNNHLLLFVESVSSPRLWFGALSAFSLLFVYSTYTQVIRHARAGRKAWMCDDDLFEKDQSFLDNQSHANWKAFKAVENDLVIEYDPLIGGVGGIEKELGKCALGLCSKVYINGEIYLKEINGSKEETTEEEILELTCEEMYWFWKSKEFSQFKLYNQGKQESHGIIVKIGSSGTYYLPKVYTLVAKEAFSNSPGYARLRSAYMKRSGIFRNLKEIPKLFGACLTPSSIRIMEAYSDSIQPLCEEDDDKSERFEFEYSPCYFLRPFHDHLRKQEDQYLAAITFLRNMFCFIAELERRRLFLEDFHLKHFYFSPDMSIIVNNPSDLIYHGERNLFGSTICVKNEDCAAPFGISWKNNSVNQLLYQNCKSLQEKCLGSRCVGYNATSHLCVIGRRIIPEILNYLSSGGPVDRMVKIMLEISGNIESHTSHSGIQLCAETTNMMKSYEARKNNNKNAPLV